jgi:hypothetical protein
MNFYFKNPTFSYQLIRTVATLGECLQTASKIKEGDFESWYTAWIETARRVEALAQLALEQDNKTK